MLLLNVALIKAAMFYFITAYSKPRLCCVINLNSVLCRLLIFLTHSRLISTIIAPYYKKIVRFTEKTLI